MLGGRLAQESKFVYVEHELLRVGNHQTLFDDPIFQGMAIALMAGEVAATLLSRTMVPLLYYEYKSRAA